MSGTTGAWCAFASGECWQVAGTRSCSQCSASERTSRGTGCPFRDSESQLCSVGQEMDCSLLPGPASSATAPFLWGHEAGWFQHPILHWGTGCRAPNTLTGLGAKRGPATSSWPPRQRC